MRAVAYARRSMYGLEISITDVTSIPAAVRARRENSMFWPVLAASGSMMMSEAGTPSVVACSAKWTASPRGNRAAVVGLLAPVNASTGNRPAW